MTYLMADDERPSFRLFDRQVLPRIAG